MKTTLILETYCVGIDVSKDKLDVCLMARYNDHSTKIKATKKFDNTPKSIVTLDEWVQSHTKGLAVFYVMEITGVYYEELAWYLFRKEEQVAVESAKKIKHFGISMGIKTKTDKVDAKVIASYGLSKVLKWWKPISKAIYDLRLLTRQHRTFQAQKTQLLNQLHALAHSGYENEWMRVQILPILENLIAQIDAFEKQIKVVVETDPILKDKVKKLLTIKGLGMIPLATIIAETNGFASVYSLKQLVSYAGYDISERQSGKYTGQSKISKQGNAHIRAILHFPAFNVVKYYDSFKSLQLRIYERSKRK
jgi:transposase